ncbi:centromere/kinetochore protein zw10-like protein [Iris pallida]|uniref:Centromere/kinetochore protein zw10-like protein n=1 Tax=Iris pallida TaxID=29817 RepID=A0AAX6HP52_IRIPA|nr:centromere/kinetochore protein zw10-like protein [Iris pallida]
MDVLVGSIDVRELLSSADLDAASPLSAPDLRLLIDRLNHRSLDIKSKVRSYALSHRHNFADVFSLSSSLSSQSLSLSDSLSSLLSLLSDRPLDRDIRDLVGDLVSTRRELAEKTEAKRVVAVVADLAEGVRVSREEMGAGRVKEAAARMRGLKERLRFGEEEESGEPEVFGLLRTEWTDCFDELQGDLARHVENSLHFEVENGRVRVRCKARTGGLEDCELYTTLEAMEIVGVLDYGLGKVADSMIKYVMNPAICDGSIKIFIELDENSVEKYETSLRLLPSEFQEHLDGPTIYARLSEVIKFIHKYIFFENEAWMQCFGRLTWQRMSDLIITYFLSKSVPDDASKVAYFQNIIRDAAEFEIFLKEIKMISTTDTKDERLSHFTQNVEVHFASRKRNEILAKARDIILQFDNIFSSENTLKGPLQPSCSLNDFSECVDLLFQPENCFVSKSVSQLMELVHAALKDACLSSTRVAKEFYHAARDALLLYKAIVPVKLEQQLDSISQIAIIIRNDCYYLSQEILGLAFQYRADFPSGLKKHALFVDIAPNFYQMADIILEKQIKLVENSLTEAIDGADGFQNTHQPQQYASAKFSIEQVAFMLEKVHVIWEPLMPVTTYKKSICILLDSVFSKITKDVLLLDDMAAEETLQLQGLIHMLLENLTSMFDSLIALVDEKEKSLKLILDLLNEMIPSLSKLIIFCRTCWICL